VQAEIARVSLIGDRSENQDRVEIVHRNGSVLMIVVDGMGGHAEGARASEVTIECLAGMFSDANLPLLDPQGFLIAALGAAHHEVVGIGASISLEQRPRATCAVCLIQDELAYCAHIGDSRIYQLRNGGILNRSRDHSHVELLLQEGVIDEHEITSHPMRNFVECCLGGDEPLPDMSIGRCRRLRPGDIVLLCTDGLWSGLTDEAFAELGTTDAPLEHSLNRLADLAVTNNAPGSDNTSAAAFRLGDGQ